MTGGVYYSSEGFTSFLGRTGAGRLRLPDARYLSGTVHCGSVRTACPLSLCPRCLAGGRPVVSCTPSTSSVPASLLLSMDVPAAFTPSPLGSARGCKGILPSGCWLSAPTGPGPVSGYTRVPPTGSLRRVSPCYPLPRLGTQCLLRKRSCSANNLRITKRTRTVLASSSTEKSLAGVSSSVSAESPIR